MTEVLRSAIAEVEQYPRVKLVPPIAGTLRGHAVADVIHLLAELVENATVFSAPHTQVLLRAQQVTAGLALEVEDRGLGMPGNEQKRMNALLADPDQVNVAHLLQDGRIGLFVVASLAHAARHRGPAAEQHLRRHTGRTRPPAVPARSGRGRSGRGRLGPGPAPGPRTPPTGQGRKGRPPQAAPGLNPDPAPNASLNPGPRIAPGPQTNTVRQPYVPSQPLRLHQPPQQGQGGQVQGEAPPLPLRAERPDRPTSAESIPGIRTADDVPDASHSEPGVVRGTMGLPQLPRRANQEHLVPQLREAPAPRSDDEQALHDPGLMAAFRRGIELAEARSEAEADTAPEPGLGTAADPQAWQPRAPLEPLPVRGLTATVAPYPSGPAQDAAPVDEPLETNTSKE